MKNVDYLINVPPSVIEGYVVQYVQSKNNLPPKDLEVSILYTDPKDLTKTFSCETTYGDLIYALYYHVFNGSRYSIKIPWMDQVNWGEVTDCWMQGNPTNRGKVHAVKKVMVTARDHGIKLSLHEAVQLINEKVKAREL